MVIAMSPGATDAEIAAVIAKLEECGFQVHRSTGVTRTILGAIGKTNGFDLRRIEILPGVESVTRIGEPFKLASRSFRKDDTIIEIGGVRIGGDSLVVMAGPCAVESREGVREIARVVAAAGARVLRGGAFKPRSSPYSFQGLGIEGLRYLREAADAEGLLAVTEVMEASQIEAVVEHADIVQVGARNMQNFSLLRRLGEIRKPVLLKRGISATIEEWLMSAEYIMAGGNYQVLLCERGIRTFERLTRNTLDISAIPVVKKLSHLPVLVDPSHAVGIRDKVIPVARAAVAVGSDGLIVEVHTDPEKALSDGPQSLYPDGFRILMDSVRVIAPVVGKRLG